MPTTVNAAAITNGDLIPIMAADGTTGRNNARDIRQGLISAFTAANGGSQTRRTGVLPTTYTSGEWTDLRVVGQGSPSTTITVKAGQALVPRTGEGNYLLTLTQDLNIVMNAAHGSNPRWDRICLMGYDQPTFGGDAVHGPYVVIVYGDAAGSPALPSIPTDAIEIARTLRAAGSNGDLIGSVSTPITDMRRGTSLQGGQRIMLPGDSLTDSGGYHGEIRERTGSFVPAAISALGVKVLYDYWDSPSGIWRGTQTIKWPRQPISPVTNLGGAQTATLAFVTIPDMGWPYYIEAGGAVLQGITGGATTALKDVYLQTQVDDSAFTPTPDTLIILRAPRPNGAASPTQIVCPRTTYRTLLFSGPHAVYLTLRNDSVPSVFIDVGENAYAAFDVTITPA
jgi:hypothetical protein